MLPGRKYTPQLILQILLRRAWLIVLPFALGLAAAPLLAKVLPETYRSETLIMVIPQRVPDEYVKSTVTAKVEDRLPSISNQILSRSRLERTINDFNLYSEQRVKGIMEDIVQRMRADIAVRLEGEESFRVSYVSNDPQTAQKVAARLASMYIEENLRDRENLAEETNLFLESQLNDAKERLVEHEKKLEAYRRQHAGELPSQLEANLQAIRNLQLQLQAMSESVNRLRERRLLVERQIGDVELLPLAVAPAGGLVVAADPAASAAQTAAGQLASLQEQLRLARLRYTADHPDVRAMARTVQQLEAKAAAEAKQKADDAKQKQDAPPTAAPAVAPSFAELTRDKRRRDLQAEIGIIDNQLNANLGEEDRLKRQLADYQAKVEVVPTRESELVELTRDYSTLQTAYAGLLTKREESKIAANLERRQIGEQFRVIDPASLPEKPSNQMQRIAVTVAGAILGFFLGIVAAGFLEFLDSTFKSEDDVMRALAVPVLAVVPHRPSSRERRARRLRAVAANAVAGLALIGSVTVLVLWRLQILTV